MATLLVREMAKAGAPAEQFDRLGLPADGEVTAQMILDARDANNVYQTPDCLPGAVWSQEAKNVWRAWSKMLPLEGLQAAAGIIRQTHAAHADMPVSLDDIVGAARLTLPPEQAEQSIYFMLMLARAD